jgi:hypothetical protein
LPASVFLLYSLQYSEAYFKKPLMKEKSLKKEISLSMIQVKTAWLERFLFKDIRKGDFGILP